MNSAFATILVAVIGLVLAVSDTRAAPADTLPVQTLAGANETWSQQLAPRKRTLTIFMTIWCRACVRKQPEILRWAKNQARSTRVLFVYSGSPAADVARHVREHGIPSDVVRVLVDAKGRVASFYRISETPTLLLFTAGTAAPRKYSSIASIPRE